MSDNRRTCQAQRPRPAGRRARRCSWRRPPSGSASTPRTCAASRLVVDEPGLTASRLAELSGLTTGAVTGVLDRLERAGLVVRVADPADRRRTLVRALPKGETAVSGLSESCSRAASRRSWRSLDAHELSAVRGFVGACPGPPRRRGCAAARCAPRRGRWSEMFSAPLAGASARPAALRLRSAAAVPAAAPLGPSAEARVVAELSHSDVLPHRRQRPAARSARPRSRVRCRRSAGARRASSTCATSGAWSGGAAPPGWASAPEIPWEVELTGGFSSVTAELHGDPAACPAS